METPSKASALRAINAYEKALKEIPQWIEGSGETLHFWSAKLGIAHTSISNKNNGRRAWKVHEVRIILETLKKNPKIVDDYLHVINNIDNMIAERGYKKWFIYHKCGLSNIQTVVRTRGRKNGYYDVWELDDVKKLVSVL